MTYVPKGRPLTPHEGEILGILQEEAAEVILAVSKVKRFGVGDVNPDTGVKNTDDLSLEIGDLKAMVAMVESMSSRGIVDLAKITAGMARKYPRLKEFLQAERDGEGAKST